jgi:uncharacterized protein YaiL (DUF2058 family)
LVFLVSAITIVVVISTISEVSWIGFGKDSNKSTTVEKEFKSTGEKEKFKIEKGIPEEGEEVVVSKRVVKITNSEQSFKTLWDWLQLGGVLAIPFALYYFERSGQRRAEERNELEQKQAQEQNDLEKDESAKTQREDALESYISQISQLLINTKLTSKIQNFIKNIIDTNKGKNVKVDKLINKNSDLSD